VTCHQAEVEDLKSVKKEREDALIAAKKQVAELQTEVSKSRKSLVTHSW
jgi:hypothetical protein